MKFSIKKEIKKQNRISLFTVFALFTLLSLSSCEPYGHDGLPGMAYISVNWDIVKPTYLDVGTSDIPSVFEWGVYYRAFPGFYTLDYSGKVFTGSTWSNYNWQTDYEIYENPGQRGGPGYNGRDGMNSYFDIVCSPYGPDITSYDAKLKPEINTKIPSKITITKTIGNYTIKITYTNLIPTSNYKPDIMATEKSAKSAE